MAKDEIKKVDFLTMLGDFVAKEYITEWQAGYITGMLNCQHDTSLNVSDEAVYKQLLLCIWSYMYR